MNSLLLVEDDKNIVKYLSEYLYREGFTVCSVSGQNAALSEIQDHKYDLILLDISLEDGNGFAVCRAIKESLDVPVIFLTASGDEYSTVAGFDVGADDYVAKPFRPRELVSRIKNALRRYNKQGNITELGNVKVNIDKAEVFKNGKEIFLSALEYKLLLVFLQNRGQVLSRTQLLEKIWDVSGDFVNDNTLTVYIRRLRSKIEDDVQEPTIIKTVRGMGYKMD